MTTSITSAPVFDANAAHVSPSLPVDNHVTGVHAGVVCGVLADREADLVVTKEIYVLKTI